MEYTVEQYKRCLQVARNVIECINEVQEAMTEIQNGYGWREFGESLDKVFDAKDAYEKVLSNCCIEAYEEEGEWLNENERRLVAIIEDAKRYCKGELELDLVDGTWIAMDYREDLEGAFSIEAKDFCERIINVSEAENQGVDVRMCCDRCGIAYVG